jgi:hypothetical protein
MSKSSNFEGAKVITADKAHELIEEKGQKFFWVAFTRKNDKVIKDPKTGLKIVASRAGDIRYMNCQTKVKKHLKTPNGEGKKYNFTSKRLTSIYSRMDKGYRSFSWDHLIYLKIAGQKFVVLTEEARKFARNNPDHELAQVLRDHGIEI